MNNIIFIDNPAAPRRSLLALLSAQHYNLIHGADFTTGDTTTIVLVDATGMAAETYIAALSNEPGFGTYPLFVLADAPPTGQFPEANLVGWFVTPFDDCEVLGAVQSYLLAQRARSTTATQQAGESQAARRAFAESDRKKDEFISYISHELKNPMASIKGYADLMRRRLNKNPDDPNRKGLEIISAQVGRMTLLLDQLLDFSRINLDQLHLDRRPIDIVQLAQRLIEELQPTTHHHALQLVTQGTSVVIVADENRLRQALQYLLSNAIKFSPAAGTIVVSAAPNTAGGVQVAVSDKGIGIPTAEQQRVFERFYRASNVGDAHAGLGLGLYLASEIVARHGGQIDLVSALGEGSTFTIKLPAPAELE